MTPSPHIDPPLVLIADDEPNILLSLEFLMKREGLRTCVAADGTQALAAVQRERPDLVLLDVMMPGSLDGLEMCRRLRAQPATAQVPVILLTARGQQRDIEAGREAGADTYLTKPFSPMELLDRIAALLGGSSAR